MLDPAGTATELGASLIPLWIKVPYTLFVCAVVPIYWIKYGPANFLWFSDTALIATTIALWTESSWLSSMMALAIVLPELAWNVSFFNQLIFGADFIGLGGYMFDAHRPLYVRLLSLFHVFLPVLLLWMVYRLGYERRALATQTALAWAILLVTYFVTNPSDNINWVFGPRGAPQYRLAPVVYFSLVMIGMPILIYLPTHWLLLRLFGKS